MTLYELRELFLDDCQLVKIYDLNDNCNEIYSGEFRDLPDEYEDIEISSIDNVYGDCNYIGINIELDEDCMD